MTQIGTLVVGGHTDPRQGANGVVRLEPGAWKPGQRLAVDDIPALALPLGAPYEDGSARHVLLRWVDRWRRHQERAQINETDRAPEPFVLSPSIGEMLGWKFELEGRWNRVSAKVVDTSDVSRTWRFFYRDPQVAGDYYELTLEVFSDSPIVRWWIEYGWSDPRTPEVTSPMGPIRLLCLGPRLHVAQRHKVLEQRQAGDLTTVLLQEPGAVGDGQAQLVTGLLDFSVAVDKLNLVHTISPDWADRGLGPLSYFPRPDWSIDEEDEIERLLATYPRHPWSQMRFGGAARAGDTGEQAGFGLLPYLGWVAPLSEDTRIMDLWMADAYQQTCRPTHFRGALGDRFRHAEHPGIILWDQRPHHTSPDRLGKDRDFPEWIAHRRAPNGSPWRGLDREHFSLQHEVGYGLMSGDRLALELIDYQVELFLGTHAIDTGNPSVDGQGTPRAIGRGLYSGAWLYWATGREDLKALLSARGERLRITTDGEWSTFATFKPTDASGGLPAHTHSRPWEDSIAVFGASAVQGISGSENLREKIAKVGRTVAMKGYGLSDDGQVNPPQSAVDLATAMAWNVGGAGPSRDAVRWAAQTGAGYRRWGVPCLKLMLLLAKVTQTTTLEERCTLLLGRLERSREGFDEDFSDWWAIP